MADPIEEFESSCKKAPLVQEQLLEYILETNKGVEYLQKYANDDPNGNLSPETFKSRVPLVCYEDIACYVERIADGDNSPILSNDPVMSFSLSSGTTGGRPKMIPQTALNSKTKLKHFEISGAYRARVFPSAGKMGLAFYYAGKQFETKSGLKIGAGSTNYFRSEAFKTNNIYSYSSPNEVILGYDWRESTYCHLLCGLLRRDKVDYIVGLFAFTIVEALRMLGKEWEDICHDLRTGTLNHDKVKDTDMRTAVQNILEPSPELADFVTEIFQQSPSLKGIIHKLWPNASYIWTVGTGAMRPYVPILREYAGESLPITYMDYVSSEACVGINIEPLNDVDDVSFTVVPNSFYFEFIPLEQEGEEHYDEQGGPVGVGGVQIGKLYEIVVTSIAGLYRYKMGDVVKVTGFLHKSPQLSFCRRRSAILSINTDKTDEEELQSVICSASKEASIPVSNFTSYADMSSEPGHYVIYWELVNPNDYLKLELLEKCCGILDKSMNNPYMRGRAAKTIGPLELIIVRQGTFSCLLDHALSKGASPGQYKTPRCIKNIKLVKLLEDGACVKFNSPEFPPPVLESWKPMPNHLL